MWIWGGDSWDNSSSCLTENHIILSNENKYLRERENERTGIAEEVVTLEVVAEVEDVVEVVLELNLDVVDPIAGDRILERIPGIKPAVVDVAGVFLSLSFPAGCVGVGTVGFVSKKSKRPYN